MLSCTLTLFIYILFCFNILKFHSVFSRLILLHAVLLSESYSVLFCSALWCSILFYSVLSCFVLFCPFLFCFVLFCSLILSCLLFYSIHLFCSVLHCSTLLFSFLFWILVVTCVIQPFFNTDSTSIMAAE